MSEEKKPDTLVITLTDHAPVKIVKAEWPTIASASDSDNREHEFQANRTWKVTVRQHADGRALVYGHYSTNWQNEADIRAGEMLAAGNDIPTAISRIVDLIGGGAALARWCIANLPAQDV